MTNTHTTAPLEAGNIDGIQPEFLRTNDLRKIFGLARGTVYNLHKDGRIKGVLLRIRGQKSGCRLWDAASVRAAIRDQMNQHARPDSSIGFKSLEAGEAPVTGGSATALRGGSNSERAAEVFRTSSAASRKPGISFIARAAAAMERQLKEAV